MNGGSKKTSVALIAVLLSASASTMSWADVEPCISNLAVKQGLFEKRIYKTWQDFPIAPLQTIYRRAYKSLIKEGWIINQTDKENGVILALQQEAVIGEGNKIANLNVFVENAGKYGSLLGSVKVTLVFSVPSALHEHDEMIQQSLCTIMADIKQY